MLAHLGAKITQLVGVPADSSWSQVQVLTPSDPDELSSGGALVCVLCLPSSPGAAASGNEQLQGIIENFQQHLSEDRLTWLKQVLEEFASKNHSNERLLLILVVPHETKRALYVGGLGPMKVLVERQNKKQQIFSEKESGKVVSGWLSNGDIVVAGSSEFIDEVWQEESGPVSERLEEAQTAIGSSEQQSLMAGVVLEINPPPTTITKSSELPSPAHLHEYTLGEVPETETAPPPRMSPLSGPNLHQRLLGGKALSWLSGENSRPSRKASLIVGAIFLGLLVASIAIGSVRKESVRAENEFTGFIEPLEHSLEEAVSLKTINAVRSRSLVAEVRDRANAAGDKFNNDRFGGRWKEFLARLDQVWAEVSGESQTVGKLWLDLTVIRDYLQGDDLVLVDDERLGVVDRANGAAVIIDLLDKNAQVVGAGEGLKQAKAVDVWRENVITLTPSGVSRFGDPKPAKETLLEKDGEIWDQTTQVAGFAGNLYLAGGVDIWRYPGLEGEIANRQRWLKPGVEPNLTEMADWAIDGEVWILRANGQILRFSQGQEVGFEIKGLVKPLANPKHIAIDSKNKELVILDTGLKSILVISQESGDYKRQLVWDRLVQARDLIVDPTGRRIFVVIGHELFELPL